MDSQSAAKPNTGQRSDGGLCIATGLFAYLIGVLQFSPPGERWPTFLTAFLFSAYAAARAQRRLKRYFGMVIMVLSGGTLAVSLTFCF
jgi:hypothetical protein